MEVRELRIGNLTNVGVVNEIQKECFYVHDGESSLKNTWFDIKPIPLTEQLLIDLKFVEIEFILTKRYESSCGKILIYIMPDGGIFANGVISDIRLDSLHQLQNLYFAITGEELINKTIKYEISINKSI